MESLPDESANLTPCFEEFLPHINASITTPVSTPSGTEVDSDEDDDVSNAEDEEMSDNGTNLGGALGIHSSGASRKRKYKSSAWKEYVKIRIGGEVTKAECRHCATRLSARRGMGTSALLKHLRRCKVRKTVVGVVDKLKAAVMSPDGVSLRNWRFDQEVSRRELVRMIVLHELPLSLVDYDGFRRFVSSLNPIFNMISRRTLTKDCSKLFEEQKLLLQDIFKRCDSQVSLTMDMWTSNQTIGYMCVTCHFIDADWKIQKRIIRFSDLETPHTGVAMFNIVLKTIQDWNCEDKIFAITLDNASNNNAMAKLLKNNLLQKGKLIGKGRLLHQRCGAHVMNLIGHAGLVCIEPIVTNFHESIKYIKGSQSRKEKFAEIMAQVGVACQKRPCSDVPTRWNSTFLMIVSALPFRSALDSLALHDKNYTYKPSPQDWEKATRMCEILQVLYVATNVISGQLYPTSNLYFQEIWEVKLILEKHASQHQEDHEISKMLDYMKTKFDKYWKVSWLALSIPVILDPRFKMRFLEFRFGAASLDNIPSMIVHVKKFFRELFNEYSQVNNSSMDSTLGNVDVEMHAVPSGRLADWDQQLSLDNLVTTESSSEYEEYMNKPPIARDDNFDILCWWKSHASDFTTFARMARDILAVPASTVPSESAFSTGKRVISNFRSRLTPKTVETLVCLQDWIRASNSSSVSTASIFDFPAEDEVLEVMDQSEVMGCNIRGRHFLEENE